MNLFIGIDPGLGGYVASVLTEGFGYAQPIPTTERLGKRCVDAVALFDLLANLNAMATAATVVGIEAPTINPKFGKATLFTFGKTVGGITDLALVAFRGRPVHVMPPKEWQRLVGLRAAKDRKVAAVEMASRLAPGLCRWSKARHDIADAYLIGLAASRLRAGGVEEPTP